MWWCDEKLLEEFECGITWSDLYFKNFTVVLPGKIDQQGMREERKTSWGWGAFASSRREGLQRGGASDEGSTEIWEEQ